jgi:TRAP-type mannitol/chloroaromatic compound transport system substrate-binding protein
MATHRSINRTTVLSFVLCIFILLGTVSMVQAKTFRFTCQNVNAMEHPGWQVIARMAEDLKVMSQGQILIDQVGPGGLVKSPQTFEATGSGAIDMAITYGAYHGGIVPVGATSFALPGDPRDMWETLNFYYEEGGLDFLRTQYAKHGVYYAGAMVWPGYGMFSRKKVESLEDIRNLKVRAAGTMATMLHRMGVSTTFIPFAEIYVAMSRGAIDATVSGSHAENYLQNLHEVGKFMVVPDFSGVQTLEVLVNKGKFDSMPDHLKAMFETAIHRASLDFTRTFMQMEKRAEADMVSAGVTKVELPQSTVDEIKKAADAIWDEVGEKDEFSAQYIEMIRTHLKKLGY